MMGSGSIFFHEFLFQFDNRPKTLIALLPATIKIDVTDMTIINMQAHGLDSAGIDTIVVQLYRFLSGLYTGSVHAHIKVEVDRHFQIVELKKSIHPAGYIFIIDQAGKFCTWKCFYEINKPIQLRASRLVRQ